MVDRLRLIEMIGSSWAELTQLTVIQAPTGYGKSTLIDQWVTKFPSSSNSVIRIDVGAGEEAPLEDLLDRALPSAAQASSATTSSLERTVTWAQSRAGGALIIVDNYEHVTGPRADETIVQALHSAPNLHFVVAARHSGGLAGILTHTLVDTREIGTADLAFSPDEVAHLLDSVPDPASCEELRFATDGYASWPLALTRRINRGREGVLELAEDLIGGVTSRSARGLLFTLAQTTELSADLLDQEELAPSTALLQDLGLVECKVNHHGVVLSMPAPIATILRQIPIPAEDDAFVRDLLARHGTCVAASDPVAAIQVLAGLGRSDLLESAVVQNFSAFLAAADVLGAALSSFTVADLAQHPALLGVRLIAGRSDPTVSRAELLSLAQGLIDGSSDVDQKGKADSDPERRLLLLVARTAALRSVGRFEDALESAREVEAQLSLFRRGGFWSNSSGVPFCYAVCGLTAILCGDYSLARRCATRAKESSIDVDAGSEGVRACYQLALVEALQMRPAQAREHLSAAAERIAEGVRPPADTSWVSRDLAEALCAQQLGDHFRSRESLRRITHDFLRYEQWPMAVLAKSKVTLVDRGPRAALQELDALLANTDAPLPDHWRSALAHQQVILALLAGQHARAEEILSQADPLHPLVISARARFALFKGDYEGALAMTRAGRASWAPEDLEPAMIVAGALAAFSVGDLRQSAGLFREVAPLIREPGGGAHLLAFPFDLLEQATTAVRDLGVVDLVEQVAALPLDQRAHAYARLTEAEATVVGKLANQQSTWDAIARSLEVSPNTVKYHRGNIYRKLRVSDRKQAVARAVDLGYVTS